MTLSTTQRPANTFTREIILQHRPLLLSILFAAVPLGWQLCFLIGVPAYIATCVVMPIIMVVACIDFRWRSLTSWLSVVMIAVAVWAISFSSDALWDGTYYHKNAVFAIAEGWSPWQRAHWEQFGGAYPVGRWVWDAAFYVATGDIRYSHLTSLFFVIATSLVTFNTLQCFVPSARWRYFWTLCFAANPVLIGQFFSGMVDGLVGITIATAWLALLRWTLFKQREFLWIGLSWLIVASTMKFTALAVAVYSIAVVGVVCLARSKVNKRGGDLLAVGGSLLLLGLVNLHPLVTNWMAHGHPLWPALGINKLDVISGIVDARFLAFPPGVRDLWSLFSYTENVHNQLPRLKFPGVVALSELTAPSPSTGRFAGMGPWFSLALLTASFACVALRRRELLAGIRVGRLGLSLLIFVFFACVVVQHGWWIRFASFVWLLPVFLCAVLWQCKAQVAKPILAIATTALIASSVFSAYDAVRNSVASFKTEQQAVLFLNKCQSGNVTISGEQVAWVRNYQHMFSDRGYPALIVPFIAAPPDPFKNFNFGGRFVFSCVSVQPS